MRDHDAHRRLLHNARREMVLVLVVVALALLWTVGYCYLNGYQHAADSWVVQRGLARPRTAEDFQQVAGLPDWVLIGIILPWMVCTALGVGLCLGLKDDDLGSDAEAASPEAAPPEAAPAAGPDTDLAQPSREAPHGH